MLCKGFNRRGAQGAQSFNRTTEVTCKKKAWQNSTWQKEKGANLQSLQGAQKKQSFSTLHFNSLIYSSATQLQLQSSWSSQQVCCSEWTSNWLLELNGALSGCQNDSLKEIHSYNFRKYINVTSTTGLHFPMSVSGMHMYNCQDEGQTTAAILFMSLSFQTVLVLPCFAVIYQSLNQDQGSCGKTQSLPGRDHGLNSQD